MSPRASTENNLPNRPEVRGALARIAIVNNDVRMGVRHQAPELVFQTERRGAAKRRRFQQNLRFETRRLQRFKTILIGGDSR